MMADASERGARLAECGWVRIDIDRDEGILDVARNWGTPVSVRSDGHLVDSLAPTAAGQAKARSLSREHGMGAFPLHTDCAHHRTPPRFVVLVVPRFAPSTSVTLAHLPASLATEDLDDLRRERFVVNPGRRRFLATVMSGSDERQMLRFDRSCMRPATTAAARLLDRFVAGLEVASRVDVDLHAGEGIVIDNWRLLHGRAAVGPRPGRVLHRVVCTS